MNKRKNESLCEYKLRQNAYMSKYRTHHPPRPLTPQQKERAKILGRIRYINNRENRLERRRKYYRDNIELEREKSKRRDKTIMRERDLKRLYGLTKESHSEILKSQNGVCAICEKPNNTRRLCVDHSHSTSKVRGLLCTKCNIILGLANDNPKVLMRAIEYLRREDK